MSMDIDERPVAGPSNSHETDEAAPTSAQVPLFFPEDDDDEQGEEGDWTDSDTEDDPVVKSIPVHFNTSLGDALILLQYPHRKPMPGEKHPLHMPSQRPPHDGLQPDIPILARSKPSVNRIQLSLPLETEQGRERQGRFDQLLAQNFRKGVQPSDLGSEKEDKKGKKKDWEDEEESNKPLSRITLKGDLVPDQTNYCVGYFKDDHLHLAPLSSVIQMRPDLTYLDRIAAMDRRANAAHKGGDQSEDDEDEEEDEEKKRKAAAAKAKKEASEAKTLNVTFKNNEEKFGSLKGAATGRQDGSLFAPWRAEEAEPWVSLPHYAPNTHESLHMRDLLIGGNTDLSFDMRPADHLGSL